MSDISSLQAELARVQAQNQELRSELSELSYGVSRADSELSGFAGKTQRRLSDSNNRINSSHENIIKAQEIQMEIDRMYVLFKNMELANKKIRECNNKKYYDFANYAAVRKIVQGMLDNLNVNLVSDRTIYKSIEKEHLKTPDYWLTAALISIMGWRNDDRALADRALDLAVKLDRKNAAIFYMLFNLRMGRDDAALKWFMVYQDCELKGSDQRTFLLLFSMLSKTTRDDLDPKMKREIADFINKVIDISAHREGYSEQEVIDKAEKYLTSMKDSDQLELTMMKRCLLDYGETADVLLSAQNNVNILQFILDVGNVTDIEKNNFIDEFINEEVAKPNATEKSVYEDIEYNELIIQFKGDVDQARNVFQTSQNRKARDLNLISEMIDWIYATGDKDVNPQMRRNMFALTTDLQRKSVFQYAMNYRSRLTNVHPVQMGDYSTQADFSDRAGESRKITEYYENEREQQLSQIKYTLCIIGAILTVAGIGGAIAMMMLPLLVFPVIGIAMAVYNVISNDKQKKLILSTCDMNIRSKNELMDQLFAEYQTYLQLLAENDAYQERIRDALDQF